MSLKFGTSGLRGLAADLVGAASFRYTLAFLRVVAERFTVTKLLIGSDRRDSSPAIVRSVAAAARAAGLEPVFCGALPTPALALESKRLACPAVMVSGSHIPADQNGLKFYDPLGEIDKPTEAAITAAVARIGAAEPALADPPPADGGAFARYLDRYRPLLAHPGLKRLKIGLWGHSSVARDAFADLFAASFGRVERLGWVESFVPVDTEAVEPADAARFRGWAAEFGLDAIISTDADADRPLLTDATGRPLRGDLLGILTAKYLGADVVVTPVSSNSGIEETGLFARVLRTRIGSPYVIEGMARAAAEGGRCVVGFEANGGLLLGSDVEKGALKLDALPTRDALISVLSVLNLAAEEGRTLAELAAAIPLRAAQSGRLPEIPFADTAAFLDRLSQPDFAERFFAPVGAVEGLSTVDGLRFALSGSSTVHYRGSGNAPELRCYAEAPDAATALRLLDWGLAAAKADLASHQP